MEKTIFYSWQSDLPNSKNRGFIGHCIEKAISEINEELLFEAVIDRDTKNTIGTPDIVATIFSKIDKASIFIADVSFINPNSNDKKCPNPNVLIELGYAVKSIGWDKVICIFNSEFGKVEELPFDLRFRRPLIYEISNQSNKTKDKKALTANIKQALIAIINHQLKHNELQDYVKKMVDKEVLTLCNHLLKLIFGHEINLTPKNITALVNTTENDLTVNLFEKKIIGFSLFKDWQDYSEKLESLMNQPFFTQNADSKIINAMLKLIKNLRSIAALHTHHELFTKREESEGFRIVDGQKMNPENPKDGYLLLKNVDKTSGMVVDWGKIRKYNVRNLLSYYTIKSEIFKIYIGEIHDLLISINSYVEETGDEFILDPIEFRNGVGSR